MSFTHALPRMVDRHVSQAIGGLRQSVNRYVTCYIVVKERDDQDAGHDSVNDGPIQIDVVASPRKTTYKVHSVNARIRWGDASTLDTVGGSGNIKLGDVAAYVSVDDSPWLQATQNDPAGYCVIDGHRVKIIAGPQPEGVGNIIEMSYAFVEYTRDGLMDTDDGGIKSAL